MGLRFTGIPFHCFLRAVHGVSVSSVKNSERGHLNVTCKPRPRRKSSKPRPQSSTNQRQPAARNGFSFQVSCLMFGLAASPIHKQEYGGKLLRTAGHAPCHYSSRDCIIHIPDSESKTPQTSWLHIFEKPALPPQSASAAIHPDLGGRGLRWARLPIHPSAGSAI